MEINQLKDIISRYEYGQFNILDNGMKIIYNPKDRKVMFQPFYHYGSSSNRGSCGELMGRAYLDIRREHPDLYVTRVEGTEPNFFHRLLDNHCFLFISRADLMKGVPFTSEKNVIERVVDQNPIVVDPSFKVVAPFSESGYRIKRLLNQGLRVTYYNDLVEHHNGGVPLGIDSSGQMIYLIINLNSSKLIDIGVQSPRGEIPQFNLGDSVLDTMFREDPRILRFIDLLRQRKISESQEHLEERQVVFIE